MQLPAGTRFTVDAILFDMDGTLVDSTPVVVRQWQRWSARHGLDGDAVVEFCFGRKTQDTVRRFLPACDVEAEAAAIEGAMYADAEGVEQVAGAGALLAALPSERWALVTSAIRDGARLRMQQTGLPQPRVLVAAEDVTAGKPDPQGYRAAAAALGVAPERCLVLEDAPAGLAAGHAAGARTVALRTTFGAEQLAAEDWIVDLTALQVAVKDSGIEVEVI